jgi:CheY-like chemotaxis protein
VEDLPDFRATTAGLLRDEGYAVRAAASLEEALALLEAEPFDVAVLDVRLDESDESNQDGLRLMHQISQQYPSTASIILTGYANVEMVRDALQPDRTGHSPAFGFLQKSEISQLTQSVSEAVLRIGHKTSQPLSELLAQGENEQLEFKSSLRWDYDIKGVNRALQEAAASAIAGMLNGRGGQVVFGVTDEGTVIGIENDLGSLRKANHDGFRLLLSDVIETHLGIENVPFAHTRFERIDDKEVCIVTVEPSPRPVFLHKGDVNKFLVRRANSTRSLDVKETTRYIQSHWGVVAL